MNTVKSLIYNRDKDQILKTDWVLLPGLTQIFALG